MRNTNLKPWPARPGTRLALFAVISLVAFCLAVYKTIQAWPPLQRYYLRQYILSEISRPAGMAKNQIVLVVSHQGDRQQASNSDVEAGNALTTTVGICHLHCPHPL